MTDLKNNRRGSKPATLPFRQKLDVGSALFHVIEEHFNIPFKIQGFTRFQTLMGLFDIGYHHVVLKKEQTIRSGIHTRKSRVVCTDTFSFLITTKRRDGIIKAANRLFQFSSKLSSP